MVSYSVAKVVGAPQLGAF